MKNPCYTLQFQNCFEIITKEIVHDLCETKDEYAAVVWCSYLKKCINKLEKVQGHATSYLPDLKDKSYEESLEALSMPKLKDKEKKKKRQNDHYVQNSNRNQQN